MRALKRAKLNVSAEFHKVCETLNMRNYYLKYLLKGSTTAPPTSLEKLRWK